jgi:hypothetical protein
MASLVSILQQAGFTGQGLRMALAIAMAESSGQASQLNNNPSTGDLSYGLFQINMIGAMGPERLKQYGLSSNASLFDALTNAKVAFKMSHGGTNWSPWSTYTSGAYKTYLGTSGGTDVGSGGGVTSTGAVATTTATLDPKTLASEYGLSYALIQSNSELKKLFNQAVSGNWTSDVFTAHLKNTRWWSTQSDTMRQFLTLKYTDPASWAAKVAETASHVNALAVQVGFVNLIGRGTTYGTMNATLQAAVLHSLQDGWSDERIKAWFGAGLNFTNGQMGGQAAVDLDKLHSYAYENGLTQSSSWYLTSVRNIESGKATADGVIAALRQQAAAKYSAYSAQILAGQNALDIAQPFAKTVSDLLEIDPASVDLTNKYVNKAMTATLAPGAMAGSQYTLWQLQNDVRADPLWQKTNNARETTMTTARQVGQIFGMTF